MTFPRISRQKEPKPDVLPDINNPNFHCRSCNKSYTEKSIYYSHIKVAHKMTTVASEEQYSSILNNHTQNDSPYHYCNM
jgi:hypothetical protein